jgi:hypothetical protein
MVSFGGSGILLTALKQVFWGTVNVFASRSLVNIQLKSRLTDAVDLQPRFQFAFCPGEHQCSILCH